MKFRFKNGAILLHRVGPMNAQHQTHDSAPCRRGVYAFVWPYFDPYFTWHQLDKFYVPKRLTYDAIDNLHIAGQEDEAIERSKEREDWQIKNKERIKKLMRPKKMWWNKPFWSRIPHNYDPDKTKSWYYWDNLREWSKEATKRTTWVYVPYTPPDVKIKYPIQIMKSWADDFEVVLPM